MGVAPHVSCPHYVRWFDTSLMNVKYVCRWRVKPTNVHYVRRPQRICRNRHICGFTEIAYYSFIVVCILGGETYFIVNFDVYIRAPNFNFTLGHQNLRTGRLPSTFGNQHYVPGRSYHFFVFKSVMRCNGKNFAKERPLKFLSCWNNLCEEMLGTSSHLPWYHKDTTHHYSHHFQCTTVACPRITKWKTLMFLQNFDFQVHTNCSTLAPNNFYRSIMKPCKRS